MCNGDLFRTIMLSAFTISNSVPVSVCLTGVPAPPLLVKAEVTPAPKDAPIKKAMPSQFPLLERVKGKSAEQLKALEESFQRSSSPKDADIGKRLHLSHLVSAIHSVFN